MDESIETQVFAALLLLYQGKHLQKTFIAEVS